MSRKQITFYPDQTIRFEETDWNPPSMLGETEVLLQTAYTFVSPGTELAILSGLETYLPLPGCPGYIGVSHVVAKGKAVHHVNEGDLVYNFGPHASTCVIDTTDRWKGLMVRVPEGLEPDRAGFARMISIAMTSLRNSSIALGDCVLVNGLGLVGHFAARLAELQGARVAALDIDDGRLNLARDCGIQSVFRSDDPQLKEVLHTFTRGRGFSTIIDASGVTQAIQSTLAHAGLGCELILLGSPRAPWQADVTALLKTVHLPPFITIKTALEWTIPTFRSEFHRFSIEQNTEIIFELLRTAAIQVAPLYTHRKIHPSRAPEIYHGLQHERERFIGVSFDWTEL
jgi:threonine dehydrogenase-like Zn-dependent dehydrogenase